MRQGGGCHNPALPFREGDTEGNTSSRVYCVTGANGLLASWLIKCLLERGFHVRGSLRNIEKGEPLRHLAGAEERLELFEADLLDETSLPPVIRGCHGVFAVASPLPSSHQDEGGVIDLMTAATINLLKACRDAGTVKRVVFTSSMFAALQVPHEGISCLSVDESFWTSPEYCREQRMASWSYMAGKTEAEKVALEFDPQDWTVDVMRGSCYVHVDDCARAHILLMEDHRAHGRYLCSACDSSIAETLNVVSDLLKSFNVPPPKLNKELENTEILYKLNSAKLKDLGFAYNFGSVHEVWKETIISLIEKGLLKQKF
ncbi:hypothetical protein KP509_01G027500 [Ceratopteris richardii]|uniref:NAD(P)-binding domain-containing protein n=1 Tax=Ceratopteris richardii TaxID=49495 RepID=A0A8T2VK08_CERRI|nr:hypothetical protein KP509_01G027500 [Ceratopteris richardii]KAH7445895.1 hypothetical protein KP509_01G027500 [Ceratopteris richardii]KAH7445897.1 hypothetical protein KP509_01G027500 [Ceratopteris richardii]